MDKLAAEKIANEYYNLGVQLAAQNPEFQKKANILSNLIKRRDLMTAGALGTGAMIPGAMQHLNPGVAESLLGLGKQVGEGAGQAGNQLLELLPFLKG